MGVTLRKGEARDLKRGLIKTRKLFVVTKIILFFIHLLISLLLLLLYYYYYYFGVKATTCSHTPRVLTRSE